MRVAVIGGGAAGQLAAIKAAEHGHAVTLFEQNEKLGKKLFITGKGRCNLTNACDRDGFFRHVVHNPRFLYSAYANFDSAAIVELVESAGVPTKVERGQRVFPASDKSSDVLKALERTVRKSGVDVRLNTRVSEVLTNGERVSGVRVGETVEPFDAVILATGGLSYPSTGSTGDGLRFAIATGHAVTPPVGSLIPLETEEPWCADLSGLTLKNVTLTAYNQKGKEVYSELGEMLFTHFGVSGPLVLSASALIAENPAGTVLSIDLKPGLTEEQLDARLLRDLSANAKKTFGGALGGLLPQRLLGIVLETAGVDAQTQAGNCTKSQRRALVETLKGLKLHVRGARPIAEAIITRGGVKVSEVNPSTMESKKVKHLYFAGEMLDTDAFTGGFNLQIAWSTGALAGNSIPTEVKSMKQSIGIDGPAGAGKSTVAKLVAKTLGIPYLDTGAMYRAVAVAAKKYGIGFADEEALSAFVQTLDLRVHYEGREQRMLVDGEDVTGQLRTEEISQGASLVSRVPAVRDRLVELQREVAHAQRVVMDGRDICTNVLPDTPYKFFITATAEERANRRYKQLLEAGQQADYDTILKDILLRDRQDSERAYKPLYCGEDTKRIDTTELTIEEVVNAVLKEV